MFLANKLLLILVVLGLAVLANLVFLDYKIFTQKTEKTQEISKPSETPTSIFQEQQATPSSSTDIQAVIDSKIAQLREELLKTIQGQPKTQTQTTTPTQISTQQPKEIFITLGAGGSTTATTWTDVSGTSIDLDKGRYPGATIFYFQANLKSDAPDRTSYARLYDVNNKVGIQGSEISYTGLTSKVIESGQLTFHFGGKLTLVVQVHSLNGNLATADSPKIRVAY
jgi:hypothetical protein